MLMCGGQGKDKSNFKSRFDAMSDQLIALLKQLDDEEQRQESLRIELQSWQEQMRSSYSSIYSNERQSLESAWQRLHSLEIATSAKSPEPAPSPTHRQSSLMSSPMQIDSDHRVTSTLRAIALPSHAFSPAARASAAAEIATSRAKTTQAAQDLCNRIDRLLEEATAWNSEGISSQEAELLAYAAQAISKRQQRAERSAKKAEMRRESALKRSQDDSGSDQEIVESDSDEDTNGVFGSKSTINRQTQLRQSLQSVAQWLDDKTKQMWNDDEVFADMEQSAAQSDQALGAKSGSTIAAFTNSVLHAAVRMKDANLKLTQMLRKLTQETVDLRAANKSLAAKYRAEGEKRRMALEDCDGTREINRRLQAATAATQSNSRTDLLIAKQRQQISTLQMQLSIAQSDIHQAKLSISARDHTITVLQSDLAATKPSTHFLQAAKPSLVNQPGSPVHSPPAENAALRQRFDQQQVLLSQSNEELERLREEVSSLRHSLDRALTSPLSPAHLRNNSKLDAWPSSPAASDPEGSISDIHSQSSDSAPPSPKAVQHDVTIDSDQETPDAAIARLNAQAKEERQAREQCQLQLREAMVELQAAEDEFASMEQQIEDWRQKHDTLSGDLEQARAESLRFQSDLDASHANVVQLSSTVEALQVKVASMSTRPDVDAQCQTDQVSIPLGSQPSAGRMESLLRTSSVKDVIEEGDEEEEEELDQSGSEYNSSEDADVDSQTESDHESMSDDMTVEDVLSSRLSSLQLPSQDITQHPNVRIPIHQSNQRTVKALLSVLHRSSKAPINAAGESSLWHRLRGPHTSSSTQTDSSTTDCAVQTTKSSISRSNDAFNSAVAAQFMQNLANSQNDSNQHEMPAEQHSEPSSPIGQRVAELPTQVLPPPPPLLPLRPLPPMPALFSSSIPQFRSAVLPAEMLEVIRETDAPSPLSDAIERETSPVKTNPARTNPDAQEHPRLVPTSHAALLEQQLFYQDAAMADLRNQLHAERENCHRLRQQLASETIITATVPQSPRPLTAARRPTSALSAIRVDGKKPGAESPSAHKPLAEIAALLQNVGPKNWEPASTDDSQNVPPLTGRPASSRRRFLTLSGRTSAELFIAPPTATQSVASMYSPLASRRNVRSAKVNSKLTM